MICSLRALEEFVTPSAPLPFHHNKSYNTQHGAAQCYIAAHDTATRTLIVSAYQISAQLISDQIVKRREGGTRQSIA
jgi:hypothetical protein